MSTKTLCRYDCYQINLNVNLSEEDSCFFDRYGPSLFNIRKCGQPHGYACCAANPGSGSGSTPTGVPVVMPDAVILAIDIDRCDCTKALFNLYVRLPCKPLDEPEKVQCAINDLENEYVNCTQSCLAGSPGTNQVNAQGVIQAANPPNPYAGAFISTNIALLVTNVNALLTPCQLTQTELSTAIANALLLITYIQTAISPAYNGTCTLTSISTLLANLYAALSNYASALNASSYVFEHQKFCITSGASGNEREVITFDVAPLPTNVVASGVFTKCYSYEATRVPCRVLNEEALAYCSRKTGIDYVVNSVDCCNACNVDNALSQFVPDTLRIMFPMTKAIKCLVPDFGMSGTILNAAAATVSTKVRLVSCSPCKFYIPAKLSFDKEKCMVCLDVSAEYLISCLSLRDMEGYEHRFGCDCDSRRYTTKCCNSCDITDLRCALLTIQKDFSRSDPAIDVTPNSPGDKALWTALGNVLFQTLARSKKIDVMGVNKCVENVLFNFQVCYVPYRGYCVDLCGCKAKTDVPDYGTVSTNTDTYPLTPSNSFKVQADAEYSYEFLKLSTGYVNVVECNEC
jgi:hypothetical protein